MGMNGKGCTALAVGLGGVVALLGAGAAAWLAARPASAPQITIQPDKPALGQKSQLVVTVKDPNRGLSYVHVCLVQGGKEQVLEEQQFSRPPPWKPWGDITPETSLTVEVGKQRLANLTEGVATVLVKAGRAPGFFTEPDPVVESVTLPVRLSPPTITPTSQAIYVAQGGVEAVVYTVGDSSVRDGVQAGEWFFPGYPLPGGRPGERFALFGVPYDMSDGTTIKLVAEDDVGNRQEVTGFIHKFTARPPGKDTIRLSDPFMQKVVGEISPRIKDIPIQGTLIEQFITINSKVRSQNIQQLTALCTKSTPRFLWKQTFAPMINSKIMGAFADHRTYMYQDKPVDQQYHLGFDLASVQAAPVPASNPGTVLYADYLGIYGNCVLLDHGYGLTSFYAHLSSIDVKAGDMVERGQIVGKTGATGMAGGDHLHFVFLLQGLAVNPIEWWDGHWIHDRLVLKLGAALPFEKGADPFSPQGKGRRRR